ncbi:hypothetical protein E2C01_044940 [Portunus trituberculatus]|uniref:Uncharacterized protein n=1 Tax=Portunus trituberculatus TaxID=210409 RepID=A0A5B7FUD8_PORTR|nr:hypothetical protein [Portunus trituberculatus]
MSRYVYLCCRDVRSVVPGDALTKGARKPQDQYIDSVEDRALDHRQRVTRIVAPALRLSIHTRNAEGQCFLVVVK